jgi:Family of unknown function (DUF5941)/CDP-alcohol phosphatidyltransferase
MIGVVVGYRPGSPAAAERMQQQLTRSGAQQCVVTGAGAPAEVLSGLADLLGRTEDDVLIAAADLVLHDEALADLVRDPRPRTAVLVSGTVAPDGAHGVRRRAGRIVDAGSDVHRVADADGSFTGALWVAVGDRLAASAAAGEMAHTAARHGWTGDPVDLLLVALVRRDVPVGAVSLDPWPWGRGDDAEPLREQVGGLDPYPMRLRRAGKADDGAWATLVIRRLSRRMTPLALRRGLTPNQITVISFVVGLAAAGCFAAGDKAAGVGGLVGALLLQLSLVVDCVDGEVARFTRTFTPLGAWLDASTDRVKEFACYAGLAVGAGGRASTWLFAASMLTLQATRHTTDYTFTAVKDLRETTLEAVPLDQEALVGAAVPASRAARAVEASQRGSARAAVRWAKKVAHMGIGERWLVISVGAALGLPGQTLVVLLVLGLLSFAYTATGRTARARSWPRAPSSDREREIVVAQLDPGPFALGLVSAGPSWGDPRWLDGRFLWTIPPALRLGEYATILLLAWASTPGAVAAAFTLLLVVAYHHYDELYGVLNRLAPQARSIRLLGLGVDGRVFVVAVLAMIGALVGVTVMQVGLWVAAVALGVLFLGFGSLRVRREIQTDARRGRLGVAGG